ncbi:D-alanyl-D-alanine carboxypeptidase family protein [Facklamia sp. 7083-14-GEN3]|uniref:M15 family metallopeptidase n=1 Tax=Facklamia sp. 7083-14-GEN3 TaxID=2973478 RepID=UPI00215D3DBE|nr:M15 family metallopeptidase [Facklamia sp. 7083-14-GEN3]MCR8969483.1 M15 family metallopeptidase [Facklamia sp. 7083-14-GEN3]
MNIKKIFLIFSLLLIFPFDQALALTKYNLPAISQIKAIKSNASIDELIDLLPEDANIVDPYLFLVNPSNPNNNQVDVDLVTSIEGIPYAASIEEKLNQMLQAGLENDYQFTIISGYRSTDQQAGLESSRKQALMAVGYSESEAIHLTNLYTAPANATEHMTGLAIDILGQDWTSIGGGLTENYSESGSAQWLEENAAKYGFILRYPQNKSEITTFNFEPWHFRYVGQLNAQFIMEHGLTLEEYLALIEERDKREKSEKIRQAAKNQAVNEAREWLEEQKKTIDELFNNESFNKKDHD